MYVLQLKSAPLLVFCVLPIKLLAMISVLCFANQILVTIIVLCFANQNFGDDSCFVFSRFCVLHIKLLKIIKVLCFQVMCSSCGQRTVTYPCTCRFFSHSQILPVAKKHLLMLTYSKCSSFSFFMVRTRVYCGPVCQAKDWKSHQKEHKQE